jgi:hypothetical protein
MRQVYSPAGRRLVPPIRLDSATAFLASDAGHRLLAASTTGAVRVWDVQRLECVAEASVAPLLADGGGPGACHQRVLHALLAHEAQHAMFASAFKHGPSVCGTCSG